MNQIKLNEIIKEKRIVVPLYMLRLFQELNLSTNELILLIYLQDKDKMYFDPEKISSDLGKDILFIMENISNLQDKGLVVIETIKNDKGVMEEVINMDLLYDKITIKLIDKLNTKDEENINIHDIIEREFNRKLTPLEHEVIDDWERNEYNKELIKEAIKEASINGVNNLRYIDKILFDWNKNGIKNVSDIKKEEKKEIVEDIYNNYEDWLNYDDEEI